MSTAAKPQGPASDGHIRKLALQIAVEERCREQCALLNAPVMLTDLHIEKI